ncbi:MAG: tetratricopeptide repeat protein [Bryobacteraceae bacterium]|nr:tetratricopeptide repeat protein [Bryobacteraceae bacterium]
MAVTAMARVYSAQKACSTAKVTPKQLKVWRELGLAPREEEFGESGLQRLFSLASAEAAGLRKTRLAKAVDWVENTLGYPVESVRFARGKRAAFVKVDGYEFRLFSDQLNFAFSNGPQIASPPPEPPAAARKRREEAERHFQHGLELEQRGAPFNEIVAAYRQAAELDEKSAGAWVNLGTLYFNARMWREAERHYLKALEADRDYPLAHFNLANLYDERGERKRAFEHYEEALRLKPGYADAHYNLALLLQSTGQMMKAMKHWRTYLKLDPGSSWAAIARREMKKLQQAALVEGARGKEDSA